MRRCQLREWPRPLGMSQPGPGRQEAGQARLSAGQAGDKRLRGPRLTSIGFSHTPAPGLSPGGSQRSGSRLDVAVSPGAGTPSSYCAHTRAHT